MAVTSKSAEDENSSDFGVSPWAPRKPVPDLIAERLAGMVRSGDMKPGSRLPTEPKLAEQMGVARSSLRTALQKLQAEGVVEVRPGRGWYVTYEPARSASDRMRDHLVGREFNILDVMEVRIALEGAAAALAANRASQGKLDEIQKLARKHADVPTDDAVALLRTDEEFHEAVVEGSGNAYLLALYEMLTPVIADWRAQSFSSPEVHDRSANDHNQVSIQLRRRDEVGARLTMTSHLLGLYKSTARERRASGDEARNAAGASTVTLSTYIDVDDKPLYDD